MKSILSIETSCDDTSVALVREDYHVLCCLVASQDLVHQPFGGVVPEIASRNHSSHLLPLVDQALKQTQTSWDGIAAVAVTNRPGLIGSLIVGIVTAKTLALSQDKPLIGVHHIEGHIVAPFLQDATYKGATFIQEPFLALVVSGGHTQLVVVRGVGNYQIIAETQDDAAGEAFDKFAKMLGLPYPGGVQVDQWAKLGNDQAFVFPRSKVKDGFSFSGLKSAALRLLQSLSEEEKKLRCADLCASYQKAIVDVLIERSIETLKSTGLKNWVISGGVSANSRLREQALEAAKKMGIQLAIPPLRYCTDNAAMIGLAGLLRWQKGDISNQSMGPEARAPL